MHLHVSSVFCLSLLYLCSDAFQCITESPLGEGKAPQLIALSFTESVTQSSFTNIWQPLFSNRKNPDGNPISGDVYVPFEYTDFRYVQEWYVQGFDIGIVDRSQNSTDVDVLKQKFQHLRNNTSKFANIPVDDVIGVVTPPYGSWDTNNLTEAYIASGLQYQLFFPLIGEDCLPYPINELSIPKHTLGKKSFWNIPESSVKGYNSSILCPFIDSCDLPRDLSSDEIASWLLDQINRQRFTNRIPISLRIASSAWFLTTENSFGGFRKFLDQLEELEDVFLVSAKQVIDWVENPVPWNQFQTEVVNRTADCLDLMCPYYNDQGEVRYLGSCVPCPTNLVI